MSKAFGSKTLFEELSFGLHEGVRLGLVGPNGAGKTTLLRILNRELEADQGECVHRKGLRLGFVPQVNHFEGENTVMDILNQAFDQAEPALDPELKVGAVGIQLGKAELADPDQKASTLSGGWRKRLAIAAALVQEPDLLILDEPTNHLDFEGLRWLEKTLQTTPQFVTVSHDRFFLERSVSAIMELNGIYEQGQMTYEGNYSRFLIKRKEYFENQLATQERLKNKVRNEIEWLRRGPKARTTKSHSRMSAAYDKIDELDSMHSRTRLDSKKVGINFTASERETKSLVTLKHVKLSFDEKVLFRDLDLMLSPGKTTALVGLNGTGKTTLLKIIDGSLSPDSGTVKYAPDCKIVYFTQDRNQLNPNDTLREALSPTGSDTVVFGGSEIHINSWAQRFLFTTEMLPVRVSQLSGGEQARILISRLMLMPADVLLLDEPTNDLDIRTLEMLEENLSTFPGAVVLVSHDRYFLDQLADNILGFDGQGEATHFADYAQWENQYLGGKTKSKKTEEKKKAKKELKFSYKEKREYEGMEARILETEERIAELQELVVSPELTKDPQELQKKCDELAKLKNQAEKLYARWEELEQKAPK